ncbi:MAG TPA: 16S rRNA (adenine(1518)-N(6)/adenine(1519)-N(6))-dimethyltransferase RsmA [Candidatus Sumerlaeota bacterium]|nr:MAG: Ribosomal RNA small subunit methyltransferase A [candidate division BRC1 bacterium ADurb.Bin183]HOE63496.1 16S rRNA (adenine(1518)-N(6)/adenine(1519)-N(6))-dimethyltransferase RsmA [Candidatus Sumerlaeota bacterium]HRR31453.1 16S rRNA (adenine(1518)-N(6)/adenine(1519)-N(6))-dimethyltransferase RsmA [Candidatus Sumerlaeia bacterium]HON51389.1 16S rRNA (adenine(1518)-N(6)/adenine(1519)-N(6))-dimethyltransferase RsmA [Candidatus Sumerlaeota bacterium]HOR64558.1 16S rRNA (adenine(1518)-N(6)
MEQIHLKKRLGQHILKDESILQYIAESCLLTPQSVVLEIGSGVANLTERLAQRAGKVIAVELDEQFRIFHLRLALHHSNVEFIYQDIMDLDIAQIPAIKEAEDFVITGNIPYNITTPLIMKALECPIKFRTMVLMVQKEVAVRLTTQAHKSDTGAITLKVQYYCEASILRFIPSKFFHPMPKVDSAIVQFEPKPTAPYDENTRRAFFHFLDGAFLQKRKTILNSLGNWLHGKIERKELSAVLEAAGINPMSRAENISLEMFRRLFEDLAQFKNKNL